MPRRNLEPNDYTPPAKKSRRIKIEMRERRLGRYSYRDEDGKMMHVYGLAWKDKHLIEIDPRLEGKDRLETILHELLHVLKPDMTEEEVTRIAKGQAYNAWRYGVRCVHQK